MTLWAGRVGETALAPEVWEFLKSEDAELLPYDIQGTRLHAERLLPQGCSTTDELAEVDSGSPTSMRRDLEPGDEDVHWAIERLLGAGRAQDPRRPLAQRPGRDGVRLYVAGRVRRGRRRDRRVRRGMLTRAEAEAETPMPGYTHLQRAIPVTVGHHLLAWVEMLERDRARFAFARAQAAPSPLGAGALAGSTLPLPPPPQRRCATRSTPSPTATSRSTTSTPCAALFVHLSRIGEELVLWATSEFGFARLPENAATGSSMMPQKLNPDVAELARGKAGTAIGRLTGLLATVKGLPLAYNCDLAEDKQATFRARRDVPARSPRSRYSSTGSTFDRGRLAAAAPIRCCSRPMRPRRSSPTACRSGTRTSRLRRRFARVRSSRRPQATRLGDVAAAVTAAKERWT